VRTPRMRRAGVACTYAALVGVACSSSSSSGSSGLSPNVIALRRTTWPRFPSTMGCPTSATSMACLPRSLCAFLQHSECQNHRPCPRRYRLFRPAPARSVLTLSLPALTDDKGATLAECTQLISGSLWARCAVRFQHRQRASKEPRHRGRRGVNLSHATSCTGTNYGDRTTRREWHSWGENVPAGLWAALLRGRWPRI